MIFREGSHLFPKFGHLFPKTSYVHIYVIVRHKALIEAFSSHTARASYRQKNHNSIIRAHTHNIHACCIWIHTRWLHHTTSFTAFSYTLHISYSRCHIMTSYSIIMGMYHTSTYFSGFIKSHFLYILDRGVAPGYM